MVLRNSALGGFIYIWQSLWLGVIAMTIEKARIHFFSDVFRPSPSSDLVVLLIKPIFWRSPCCRRCSFVRCLISCRRVWRRGFGFQSSFLNSYLRSSYFHVSGIQASLLIIYFRDGPNRCPHCTNKWHKTYPICDKALFVFVGETIYHGGKGR